MKKKICGIYEIKNLVNNKSYIGESKDIRTRWASHLSALKCNRHHSKELQSDFNKYGFDNFAFNILCVCKPNENRIIEAKYIINAENELYNSEPKNSTGFYNVSKKPCPKCKQGFKFRYSYTPKNRFQQYITDADIFKLKHKVEGAGLPWIILDIDKATRTMQEVYGVTKNVDA